jgi:hypothetical protein
MIFLAFSGTQALAWNNFGHMEVAAVAWSRLTPAVRAGATQLLKLNPQYSAWTQNLAATDRDEIMFVVAATWPDFIKRSAGYHADGADNGDRPPATPEASQNKGYVDHFMHKYWHFINEPFSPDGTPLQQPSTPNAQTQIGTFRAKLSEGGASDNDVTAYDLAWLLRLVGDVHQPLHATSRFIHGQPNGDAGGNHVTVHCAGGCNATELHAFWDDVLGTSDDPHDAIDAARQLVLPETPAASLTDENMWIDESFRIAQANVYAQPIGVGAGPFALTPTYKANALRIANERVALAGARLANVLNAAFR